MFKWNWSRATAPPTLLKGPQIHERLRDESCFSPGLARLKQDSKMAKYWSCGSFHCHDAPSGQFGDLS